jgi:acetate kinase
MSAYRIKKYIGSFAAVMNGLRCHHLYCRSGENSSYIRKLVCRYGLFIGIHLDEVKTNFGQEDSDFGTEDCNSSTNLISNSRT